jgi:hypothetical protein
LHKESVAITTSNSFLQVARLVQNSCEINCAKHLLSLGEAVICISGSGDYNICAEQIDTRGA